MSGLLKLMGINLSTTVHGQLTYMYMYMQESILNYFVIHKNIQTGSYVSKTDETFQLATIRLFPYNGKSTQVTMYMYNTTYMKDNQKMNLVKVPHHSQIETEIPPIYLSCHTHIPLQSS